MRLIARRLIRALDSYLVLRSINEMTLMYRLFSVLTLTLLLSNSVGAQKNTDREKENLLGAVRSVRSQMMDYIGGKLQEKGRAKQLDTVTYDTSGNEVERVIYDGYGFLVGKEIHTLDAKGNRTESILSDPKGVVMERRVYTYENSTLIQILSYDGKGNIGLKQVNSYDANGRLREQTYYDPNKAAGKTIYKYDGKGKVSEAAFFRADDSKAVAPIGPCLGAHRVTYFYDEADRPIKVVAYEPDGKVKKSWQYSYNPKGQVVEDKREDVWSQVRFVYTYEYDSQGNWIKQIATVNHQSKLSPTEPYERKTVIIREITYY
jgi:hypothetical protein